MVRWRGVSVGDLRRYLSALMVAAACTVVLVVAWSVLPARPASAARPVLTPTPSSTPGGCELAWRAVGSPGFGQNLYIAGVDAISANDVWAVGHYTNGT